MPVRVDQAREDSPALRIDDVCVAELEHLAVQRCLHLAVTTDQDAGEALELAARIDLDAIEVVDERIGVAAVAISAAARARSGLCMGSRIALFAPR